MNKAAEKIEEEVTEVDLEENSEFEVDIVDDTPDEDKDKPRVRS